MIDNIQLAINNLFDTLGTFEKKFRISTGFFKNLLKEDDWSFIIKTHAIIEAALSQALASVLDKRLLTVFQRLDLSDSKTGKIIFLKQLGIFNEVQLKFIRKFAELRNMVVHNISYVEFNLTSYVESLDRNQRRSFLEVLTSSATEEASEWRKKLATENPKVAIWIVMAGILLRAEIISASAIIDKKSKEISVKLVEIEQELRER